MADWNKILSQGNVEDRRGLGPALGGFGLIGVVIALLFSFLTGAPIDVASILNQLQQSGVSQSSLTTQDFEGADDYEKFTSAVLGSTNDYWKQRFAENQRTYVEPKLVLFRTATRSGCGLATSDVGPHYCPADQTIYLDETFFNELQQRFKAKGGDVAEAYVIAHEVGHHVQNQLGLLSQIQSNSDPNAASIKAELQSDCYAGAWANSIAHLGIFGPGEINEAIDAAASVGDDRIQASVTGQVNPETWTHGSSAERVRWFEAGFGSGQPSTCDTFQ
jgi:predicted metalloprotease